MMPFSVKFSHVVIQSFLLAHCLSNQITFHSSVRICAPSWLGRSVSSDAQTQKRVCIWYQWVFLPFWAELSDSGDLTLLRLSWSSSEAGWIDTSMRICRLKNLYEKVKQSERKDRQTFPSVAVAPQRTKPLALSMFANKSSWLKLGRTLVFA